MQSELLGPLSLPDPIVGHSLPVNGCVAPALEERSLLWPSGNVGDLAFYGTTHCLSCLAAEERPAPLALWREDF